MECAFLDLNGRCKGPYAGFGCIKEKCTAEKKTECEYNDNDFYCRKYRKFECIGQGNCASLDDYMSFVNERRRRAHSSK